MALIGDPSSKSVLDIACGEGFYTRMIRQRGAAKIAGVDLSEGMIELAESRKRQISNTSNTWWAMLGIWH
jgi:ubiquinone/menaquinone biosynthesis C-methylase UbiE